jgi:NTE family protein
VASILPEAKIEDLSLPFAACALDLVSGEEVMITSGSVRKAVLASSAIPGLLPPVKMNGKVLADGGWVNKVPALHCFDLGADIVVGVDVSVRMEETQHLKRGFDVITRANACTEWALRRLQLGLCDLVIRPKVGTVHWADFDAAPQLIASGRQAIAECWSDLRELLRAQKRWGWLRPSRGVRRARHFRREPGVRSPRTMP